MVIFFYVKKTSRKFKKITLRIRKQYKPTSQNKSLHTTVFNDWHNASVSVVCLISGTLNGKQTQRQKTKLGRTICQMPPTTHDQSSGGLAFGSFDAAAGRLQARLRRNSFVFCYPGNYCSRGAVILHFVAHFLEGFEIYISRDEIHVN